MNLEQLADLQLTIARLLGTAARNRNHKNKAVAAQAQGNIDLLFGLWRQLDARIKGDSYHYGG